jgi:hypothetical protein
VRTAGSTCRIGLLKRQRRRFSCRNEEQIAGEAPNR